MAIAVRMPKMSDTMTEGVIANWLVKVGDKVKSGDILAEVETDKATMELENYEDGVILHLADTKKPLPIDGLIAVVGKIGEDISALLNGSGENSTPKSEPVVSVPVVSAPAVDTSKIKAQVVRMPKMSDTMTEGVIATWLKKIGDKVKSGDIIAEVQTDKATMELENYEDGYLLYIAEAGKPVEIDGIIAIVGEQGVDFQALLQAKMVRASAAPAQNSSANIDPTPAQTSTSSPDLGSGDSRTKVSPLARRLAKEMGYDLKQIKGSGENGRIVKRDIETFKPETAKPSKATTSQGNMIFGQESFTEVPLSQMRKTIARRLTESKNTAPHFYLTIEIRMDKTIAARNSLNQISPVKISFNDMTIKAVAMAIRKHPNVNSSWQGDKIRYNNHIHIGMAVAVEDGLLVPVIRFADQKTLSQIAAEAKDLGQKAKNKKLQPADWEGNTFSVSNLGMFGIEEFTSIINPPDSCILSVGGIKETVLVENGQMVIGNVMKVTLACDHRSVDGVTGSGFLQTLKEFMEEPVKMLV